MILIITLTTAGTDTGPFNLYSNVDGYISAFEVGVLKIDLVAGYTSYVVPNGTTMVRIMSAGACINYIDLPAMTTTTTTTCSLPDVTIDSQIWTGCNLSVTTYRNGDPIPEVTDPTAWVALTTGAWCYYNNDPANAATYGRLYNWYAVNDVRGLAPVGYHVPTDAEWITLTTFLGGEPIAGGPLKETGTIHWNVPNSGATNTTGFTGLPGGLRYFDGTFLDFGNYGLWWSASGVGASAWYRYMNYNSSYLFRTVYDKIDGFSVRLIKD
jgi:uncharacterized protein (TIGR02145 family)